MYHSPVAVSQHCSLDILRTIGHQPLQSKESIVLELLDLWSLMIIALRTSLDAECLG